MVTAKAKKVPELARRTAGYLLRKGARKLRKSARRSDGFRRFSIHSSEERGSRVLGLLKKERPSVPAFAIAGDRLGSLDPETVAARYLDHALESDTLPQFTRPAAGAAKSQFKSLGSETVPLTRTTTVKFRQTFNAIPVYGSLVTVELDDKNEFVSVNSSLGEPKGVDSTASIAPAEALAAAAKRAGYPARDLPQATPRLYYYYDKAKNKWALAWIIEDLAVKAYARKHAGFRPLVKDYVVDAHKGTIIAELPRTPTAAAVTESALDGLKKTRSFECERAGAKKKLVDPTLNVTTCDFKFRDPKNHRGQLPGPVVNNPPTPWSPAAVSAHANAEVVAHFLRDVVKRNNIDGAGGAMISSVNCVVAGESDAPKEWLNAFWNGRQMVYGQQRLGDGSLRSLAVMQDVVGHEMFHGVTEKTARLEYVEESGALNESYSDIFGVIIANFGKADQGKWAWGIGVGFDASGAALRDMRDPTKRGQPKHMRDFMVTNPPYGDHNDWGGVHTNSGIHNYGAYKVMTARDGAGFMFTPREIAAMFYVALTAQLTRTSRFSDSRRGVVLAAQTLFRAESAASRRKKIKAVEKGFSAAGITA